MKNLYLVAIFSALCSCGGAERCLKNEICLIEFRNRTPSVVFVGASTLLPDTSLKNVDFRLTGDIEPNSRLSMWKYGGWKRAISGTVSGKMMFFVVSSDTVDKYGIDSVVSKIWC